MRSKEEYVKMCEEVYHSETLIEKFKTRFSEKECETIDRILKEEKTLSKKDWETIYQENKDNHIIVNALTASKMLPKSILSDIARELSSTGIITDDDDKILAHLSKQELSEEDMEILYPVLRYNVNLDIDFFIRSRYDKEKQVLIPDKNILFIAKKQLAEYKPEDSNTLSSLLFVKDIDWVQKISDMDLPEEVNTAFVNNEYLPDELRNKFFQKGCEWSMIKVFTPEMAKECYESAIETVSETYDEENKRAKAGCGDIYYKTKCFLNDMITKNALSWDMELDLTMRLLNRKNRSSDNLLRDIFYHTKNQRVLELAEQIKNINDKRVAYRNRNMPEETLKKYAYKLSKKMIKNAEEGKGNKTPEAWFAYMEDFVTRIPFSDEAYKLFMNQGDWKLQLCVACSPCTPDHILNSIIKESGIEENRPEVYWVVAKMVLCAKINQWYRETDLSEETKNELINFLKESPTSMKKDDYFNIKRSTNLSYATQSLSHIAERESHEDVQKVIDFLKQEKEQTKDVYKKKYTDIIDYMLFAIKTKYQERTNMEDYQKTGDPSKCTKDTLDEIMRRIHSRNRYKYDMYSLYKYFNENIDEFYKIKEELDKREREINKEKETEIEK